MLFSYYLCLYSLVTLVYTHPANLIESRKSKIVTKSIDDHNLWPKKSNKQTHPLLQKLNEIWDNTGKIKTKDKHLEVNAKKQSQNTKVDKGTTKSKFKEVTSKTSTVVEYVDNDLEPEFEWDYLDQLQQDLADDYFIDDRRKKRHTIANLIKLPFKYKEHFKHYLEPRNVKDIQITKRNSSPGPTTINILSDNIFSNTKLENIAEYDSLDNNEMLLNRPLIEAPRIAKEPRSKAHFKVNKIKYNKLDTMKTVTDETIDSVYDPAEHYVEITLINFGNEQSTELEPFNFDTEHNLGDSLSISTVNSEDGLKFEKSNNTSTDEVRKYLNPKSMHNNLLFSERNNKNGQIQNIVEEYTTKTNEDTVVPKLSEDIKFTKVYKRHHETPIISEVSKSPAYSETNISRRQIQDGDCLQRNVREANVTTASSPAILNEKLTKWKPKKKERESNIDRKGRKRRKIKLIPLLKEKLMFLWKKKNSTTKTLDVGLDMTTSKLSMEKKLTQAINTIEKPKGNIDKQGSVGDNKVYLTSSALKDSVTYKLNDVLLKTATNSTKHKTTPITKEKYSTAQTESILYVEPTIFNEKIYYETSLMDTAPNINEVNKLKPDYKVGKRDVSPETFTAKDVAALEVIVDLMKNNPNFDPKTSLNLANVARSFKPDNKQVTNSIQVHIAVPYEDGNERKRSLDPLRVRKVFSAKMSSPVDLEYQVNSFEESTPSTVYGRTLKIESEQIPPGMYLLVDNGVLKGNFALKPVKNFHIPNLHQRSIANVTEKVLTTSISKNIGKVTLSKDMISAFNQQLFELFKRMVDNVTETQIVKSDLTNNDDRSKRSDIQKILPNLQAKENTTIENNEQINIVNNLTGNFNRNKRHTLKLYNENELTSTAHGIPKTPVHKGYINWDKIKHYFGHDRVCSCKCRVNKTLCKACAASDAVIGELIFEFDNLAKFMKDHCTEIQTYFWMNPSGGQKLRDSVHRLDKSLHDYYKRVKGKCQGKTCNTFTTYIDKREQPKNTNQISAHFLNDLESIVSDVEKATKYITCYDKKFIESGDNLVDSINECVLRKYDTQADSTTIKNVYALDNINVNIICKADTTKPFRVVSASHFENIPITEADPILDFDYDDTYNSKANIKRKKPFNLSKKSKLHKLFTYYYLDDTTESFDIKKREVNNQIEAPLNADAGGNFWTNYINKNEESRLDEEEQHDLSKIEVASVHGLTIEDTKVMNGARTHLNNMNKDETDTLFATPTHNIIRLLRLYSDTKNDSKLTTMNDRNNVTQKYKANKTKTTEENLKIESNTKPTFTTSNKSNTNATLTTAQKLKSMLTELSNITNIIGSTSPVPVNTPKKSKNIFQKMKSVTFDFLHNIEKGSFMIDENALRTTPYRQKNDLEKDVQDYIFTDNIISNITTAVNPTIVIIQDYDETNDEINKTSLNNNVNHIDYNDLLRKSENVEQFTTDISGLLPSTDIIQDLTKYDDTGNIIADSSENLNKESSKFDDEIKKEEYKSLLLSIIDFERDKLNDEWLKYVYSANEFGGTSFGDFIVDFKSDFINSKETETTQAVDHSYYDIVKDMESLQLPDYQTPPAKKGSGILNFVHKFGLKIIPTPKPQKVKDVTIEKGDTKKKVIESNKSSIMKKLKISSKEKESTTSKTTVLTTEVKVDDQNTRTITKTAVSNNHGTSKSKGIDQRSSKNLCDVEATYNHILQRFKEMPLKEFEDYVKNISCVKYKKVPDYFYIIVPKKRKFKRSRHPIKWDWIRDRRSLDDATPKAFTVKEDEFNVDSKIKEEERLNIVKQTSDNNISALKIMDKISTNFDSKHKIKRNNKNWAEIGSANITQKKPNNIDLIITEDDLVTNKFKNSLSMNIINDDLGANANQVRHENNIVNLNADDQEFERFVKGTSGIYTIVKRDKRLGYQTTLVRNFGKLPTKKSGENERVKTKSNMALLTPPIFVINFSVIYKINSSYNYRDFKAMEFLAPHIAKLCCCKLNSINMQKPIILKDMNKSSTKLKVKIEILNRPSRAINCSIVCKRDITSGLVLLTASNIPVITSNKVILFKDGVNHTLHPAAYENNKVNITLKCPTGYNLLKEFSLCAPRPSITNVSERGNKYSVYPRSLDSNTDHRCPSMVKGTRRYNWWISPPCGVWLVFICLACGCGVCISLAIMVHLTSYICSYTGSNHPGQVKPQRTYTAKMKDGRKPPSPSRVVLARFFKPSQTSSRASDSQEIKHGRKNKAPPIPPIDFN